jgi:hypothetical protein
LPPLSTLPLGTSVNFSFAQAGSVDWAQGEDNLFTLKLATKCRDERLIGPLRLKNTLTVALGSTYKDDSIAQRRIRVTDNELFGEMVAVYPVRWRVDPYFATSIRTALTESFRNTRSTQMRTASLWDPVTSQQSCGFTYAAADKQGVFTSRLGLALQQLRASTNTAMTDDPKTWGVVEAYRSLSGIEFVNEALYQQDSVITFTGRFSLFGTFDDLSVWSARFESETRFALWKSFGCTWTLAVVHDVRQSLRTQFRASMMIGLMTTFGG